MRSAPLARRVSFAALVLGAVVVLAGCRTGSPLHGRYDNFRAYYNAYYNASRVMEEGERQLDRPDQVIDRTRLLSIFPEGQGGRGAQFQEAIDKSSDLLRERASSKWADDALFLIGKAYFYQGNVVGAEQKFRETIEVAEARRNDRLADEARLWLGRTLGLAQQYDEGAAVLQERLAQAEGNRRDEARLGLILGELYAREGRYDEAAQTLRTSIPDERDADIAARALILLGQVEEFRGQFDAAVDAYRDASARRPAYEIGYAADLSRAIVLGLDAGRTTEALDLIRRMRRDDKHYQHRAEVELTYGRLLAAAGQESEALAAMRSVLYDPLLQGGPLRGAAHARLAEFYRDVRGDFIRASAHLDTAATALRQSATAERNLTRAALTNVPRTAGAFAAYAQVAGRLAEADSLLALGMLDDEAFAARIREIEARRLEEYREEQRRLAQTRAQQDFSGGESVFRESGDTGRNPAAAANPSPAGRPDAGFLSVRDQASVQANLLAFQRVWGDRPLVPNWRRQSAIDASAVATEVGGGIDPEQFGRGFPGEGPPPLDLAPIPRTPAAQAALRAERAELRYEAANALFLSLSRPDSAATLYTLALEDGGSPEVSRQIRFALAEVETGRGRTDRAEALYREIIDEAPESDLADAARLRLGLEVEVPEQAVEPTSRAYERARQRWTEGSYATAVGDFLAIAADPAQAEEAPRALLAAATAYIEWAHQDSFDVLQPLPLSVIPEGLFESEREEAPALPPAESAPSQNAPNMSPRIGAIPDERDTTKPGRAEETLPDETFPEDDDLFAEDDEDDEVAALRRALGDNDDPVENVGGRPAFVPDTPPDPREFITEPAGEEPVDEAPSGTLPASEMPGAASTVAENDDPTVLDVLAIIQAIAPGSPYARKATALRAALAPAPPAETPARPEVRPVAEADEGQFGLEGDLPIDPVFGGFTWRAQRIDNSLALVVTLNALERRSIRAAAIRDGQGYRLLVGQFATRPEAFAIREDLPDEVEAGQASIIPLDGVTLLDTSELELPEE